MNDHYLSKFRYRYGYSEIWESSPLVLKKERKRNIHKQYIQFDKKININTHLI